VLGWEPTIVRSAGLGRTVSGFIERITNETR
jgi:hypothetical protein